MNRESLTDIWIEHVNTIGNPMYYVRFIFMYNDKYYISEWKKSKWSEPQIIPFFK